MPWAPQKVRELKGQLIIVGFDIAEENGKRIFLNVPVAEYAPGDAEAVLLIGFGAGRGIAVLQSRIGRYVSATFGKHYGLALNE
jgi:hypothetical protein